MIKPPPKSWEYILIELLIDEKVVDLRIASHGTYERMLTFLLTEGRTQTLPWAIIISKSNFKKQGHQFNRGWRPRDTKGKFLQHRLFNLNK